MQIVSQIDWLFQCCPSAGRTVYNRRRCRSQTGTAAGKFAWQQRRAVVGWSPYVSSCFSYRDASEFETLHRRGADSCLQARTPYKPMYSTLEVSRTVSGALARWATLKYFGKEGMQAILGGIL